MITLREITFARKTIEYLQRALPERIAKLKWPSDIPSLNHEFKIDDDKEKVKVVTTMKFPPFEGMEAHLINGYCRAITIRDGQVFNSYGSRSYATRYSGSASGTDITNRLSAGRTLSSIATKMVDEIRRARYFYTDKKQELIDERIKKAEFGFLPDILLDDISGFNGSFVHVNVGSKPMPISLAKGFLALASLVTHKPLPKDQVWKYVALALKEGA